MALKLLFYTAVLFLAFFGYRSYAATSSTLQIGDDAPAFTLNDAQGQTHYLSDYAGKYLVLYFYPKDDTPGCTKEACHFRDDMGQLEKLGAKIVGISVDNSESHANFAKKYHLPFPLLADTNGNVADSYHALTNLYLVKIAKRYTFLINPAGKIARIYKSVDTSNHSQQIIDDLKLIQNKLLVSN
ncbi:MAG: peroxiredoxin [Methylotenera sp.]|nr:peroxiredoxin [Methylotenera sp.]